MRKLLSLALLAAFTAVTVTPATSQNILGPRIDQLTSNEGLRLVQSDTKAKKKKKGAGQEGGQQGGGGGTGKKDSY
jgi:hypothetical protein